MSEVENNDNQIENTSAGDTGESSPSEKQTGEPTFVKDNKTPEPVLTNDATHANPAKPEYDYDKRLLMEDGKTFNPEGWKQVKEETQKEIEHREKRIADLRKMVSTKDDFVNKKEEFFQDFAPKDKFSKYFSEETPQETKEVMSKMQEQLADKYFTLGLNKRQAYEMSNQILDIMEDVGVLDTRTQEQIYIDKQKWIDKQKEKLGSNADSIIREAREFIFNSTAFTPSTKNKMIDMMEEIGADFVGVVHQMKDSFGASTGGIPMTPSGIVGLPSDDELRIEYAKASPERREQIIRSRHTAGRTGKLFS